MVQEHVEKKSYGNVNLESSIRSWHVLFLQLRVVLFLRCRSEAIVKGVFATGVSRYEHLLALSVRQVDSGEVSVFGMLAADTLCFAMQQDQAAQHEAKCQEVYLKKVAVAAEQDEVSSSHSAGAATAAGSSSSAPLLIWRASEKRWRELLSVVTSEEFDSPQQPSDSSSSATKGKARSRRPLLLYFPFHNQPDISGGYRAAWLVNRWAANASRTELFQLAVSHLAQLPMHIRGALAERLYCRALLPHLSGYLRIEEGTAHTGQPCAQVASGEATGKLLIAALTDPKHVRDFIRAALDLLDFAEVSGLGWLLCCLYVPVSQSVDPPPAPSIIALPASL